MKIIFMGTPGFAVPCLQKLIDSKHDIVAVYTQSPKPAKRGMKEQKSPIHIIALENNIKVITPKNFSNDKNLEEFKSLKADVAIVAAYGQILPQGVLNSPKYGCLNIHPSALPRWRGAAPIQRTIMAGDKTTQICIMQMDTGLDTGDILLSEDYIIPPGTTADQLHDYCSYKGAELALYAIDNLDNLEPKKQSSLGVTYAKKIDKNEARINWAESTINVCNKILGLSPYPGAFFEYDNNRIKIFNAKITHNSKGEIGEVMDNNLTIKCADQSVQLLTLQKSGKRIMNADKFIKGTPIPPGTILP